MTDSSIGQIPIHGEVEPGFERLREQFEANFTAPDAIEVGASVAVYVHGRRVAHLWGGHLDRERSQPWREDTLVNVYSTTKGLAAAAIAILADRGEIDYTAPVVQYWPEFGAHGKDKVSVAQLLSHQAGVPGLREKLTVQDLYDLDGLADRLAAAEPLWPPGTAAGYHAMNWGHLANAVVKRATGLTLGQQFRSLLAGPLQADAWIGVPDAVLERCAPMIGPNHARVQPDPDAPVPRMPPLYPVALMNPSPRAYADVSSEAWRRAEIAAANGHANALAVARCYAPFANGGELAGVRVISPAGIAAAAQQEVGDAPDLVLGRPMRRARGFILNTEHQYGPNTGALGHAGAGGSPIHGPAWLSAMS